MLTGTRQVQLNKPPAMTYYVDATAGNDANRGSSEDVPWQTIAKVNASTFKPGDRILFKRGETWTGTTLTVPSSGDQFRPITFGAYGSGANPIIDGNDTVNCISGNGQDYLRFENIETTQGLNFGFAFDTEHDISVVECDAHDCGNDNMIFSDCYGCSVSGGEFYNAYVRVADSRFISGIEVKDECHDITIDGAECYGNVGMAAPAHYGAGIAIHNHPGKIMPYGITVRNCNIHDEGLNNFGIRVNNANGAVMTDRNIVIANNTIQDGAYGGIQINATAGAAFPVNGVIIRDNVIRLNTNNWQLQLINSSNVDAYRNLCRNNNGDVNEQNIISTNCTNIDLWNNTTYSDSNFFRFSVVVSGASSQNVQFKNNIIGGTIANLMAVSIPAGTGTAGLVIDYNLYQYTGGGNRWHWLGANVNYANWQAVNSNDANSPARANPLFTNPAGNDFTLQAGSPAIDKGVDVGLSYCGTAPDCGAYERCV